MEWSTSLDGNGELCMCCVAIVVHFLSRDVRYKQVASWLPTTIATTVTCKDLSYVTCLYVYTHLCMYFSVFPCGV